MNRAPSANRALARPPAYAGAIDCVGPRAAADITPAGPGTFEWRLPPLEPGEHTVSLAWSESMHSPVTEGSSPVVRFIAR